MYVTILFGVFGFIGLSSFNSQFKFLKELTDKKIVQLKEEVLDLEKNLREDYSESIKKLSELEKEKNKTIGTLHKIGASVYLSQNDLGAAFISSLTSARFFLLSAQFEKETENKYFDTIEGLKSALEIIKSINNEVK